MLKREIKFEDFDGNQTSDIFYFNISKPELIELNIEQDEGFEKMLQRIIEAKNDKALLKLFKDIVLMAYGEKSEDGKRFIKSEELKTAFSQTAAYSALFMELATDDVAATEFLKGVLPRDIRGSFEKAIAAPTPPSAPVPPSS